MLPLALSPLRSRRNGVAEAVTCKTTSGTIVYLKYIFSVGSSQNRDESMINVHCTEISTFECAEQSITDRMEVDKPRWIDAHTFICRSSLLRVH